MLPREHYLKQNFQDKANFPEGFEKGGLSDIQARLVRKQGALISALIIEEVSDATPDDLHILKVINNLSAPRSPAEQAWMKYQSIVKAKQAAAPAKPTKTRSAKVKTTADEQSDATTDTQKNAKTAKDSKPVKEAKTAKAGTTKATTPAKKAAKKVSEKV